MKPFIYGNKKIEFGYDTGEVVGYDTIVKTHVSGGGGGNTNVSISSHNEVIQKFFLKDANNHEDPYTLTNMEIPLHDGQKITMIGGKVDGKEGRLARIVIHNANRFWYAEPGKQLAKNWGLIKERTLLYLAAGFVAWLVIGSLSSVLFGVMSAFGLFGLAAFSAGLLWLIMFAGTVLFIIIKNKSNNKIVRKLDEHMDELARGVLSSH